MPFTKLDLCKTEWLELVFDHRNTEYGAYDLRKHYSDNVAKALGATVVAVLFLFVGYGFLLKHKAAPVIYDPVINVHLINPRTIKPPVTPPRVEQPRQNTQNTIRFIRPVPAPDQTSTNPPTIKDLEVAAISSVTHKGNDSTQNISDQIEGAGTGKKEIEDNSVKELNAIEVMPQYPGGEAALAKFLQKNLRYPGAAQEAGVGGKVWLSFIIEKDGNLSNITVERSAGYGMDEEA